MKHFTLDIGAQAHVLPETMILSLKEMSQSVEGQIQGFKEVIFSHQDRKTTKNVGKNNLEILQFLKRIFRSFHFLYDHLEKMHSWEKNNIGRENIEKRFFSEDKKFSEEYMPDMPDRSACNSQQSSSGRIHGRHLSLQK